MASERAKRLHVPQLVDAVDENDDWTGLTDAATRRMRQNRLNQRAYRRRKGIGPKNRGVRVDHQPAQEAAASNAIIPYSTPPTTVSPRTTPLFRYTTPGTGASFNSGPAAAQPFIFPLPVDHLITLVQYNVLRATITNMNILSLLSTIPMECGNMLAIPIEPPPDTIPPSLFPTPLQLVTPHTAWIDILPLGTMRDNMIIYAGKYNHDELCSDLVGGLFEGFNDLELTGVLVWNEPWCASGWEVTEGFVKKWGFLLKGCWDIIEATNRWRAFRGEDRLIVEL